MIIPWIFQFKSTFETNNACLGTMSESWMEKLWPSRENVKHKCSLLHLSGVPLMSLYYSAYPLNNPINILPMCEIRREYCSPNTSFIVVEIGGFLKT